MSGARRARKVAVVPAVEAPRAACWSEVADAVAGCVVCTELAASRTRTVPGVLPWDPAAAPARARKASAAAAAPLPVALGSSSGAGLMLVGEAPGAQEDALGVPFVGRSGELLDTLLAEVGLTRAEVAIANVLKCRPPGNRPPRRSEVEACRPWLERQIALAAPAVVVALGSTAVTWFLGPAARIGTARGALVPRDDYTLLATYHPSAALRFGPRGKPMAALREDLALAASLLTPAGGPA